MGNPAETYEREFVPALFGPWGSRLLELADPRPGERILDVACGTGTVARRAALRAGPEGRVAGLDRDPGMLAVARQTAERDGVDIAWEEGRAEELPFADESFDLVLCQQGLQFVPERPRAAAEMFRVLRGGGRVAIAAWLGLEHHPFFATMNAVIQEHLGVAALAGPFSLGDAGELRGLLAGAGFRDVVVQPRTMTAHFPDPAGFVALEVDLIAAALPAAQHLEQRAREELRSALEGEMEAQVRECTYDGHLVIPFHAHLARARRLMA